MQPIIALEEGTLARRRFEMDPAILELAAGVVRQRRHRAIVEIGRHDEASLEQDLEAIADAEDEAFAIAKLLEHVAEEMLQLDGENLASCNIVAVGEPAWDGQNLV